MMYAEEYIISELEKQDWKYEDLNQLQIWLLNNNYIVISDLIFEKKELSDKKSIFYFDNDTELIQYVERGNRKTFHKYCQICNKGLYFYSLDKIKDIIINYTLWDNLNPYDEKLITYLEKKFNVKDWRKIDGIIYE